MRTDSNNIMLNTHKVTMIAMNHVILSDVLHCKFMYHLCIQFWHYVVLCQFIEYRSAVQCKVKCDFRRNIELICSMV